MDTESRIYRYLQQHLDRLPMGFPMTESGLDIRLLKRLFTPDEAKLATQLSMRPEPLKSIHNRVKRSGMSLEELRLLLYRMLNKGTVLASEEGYDERRYSNAGFSPGGVYNFQVNRLTRDLITDYRQYMNESRAKSETEPKKRMLPLRTVPVEESIPLPEKNRVSSYDDIRALIENTRGQIAAVNCICRQGQDLLGESCTKTDLRETCLMIAPDHAKRHVDMGIGRYITKEETFDILEKAQEAGLVLQPENSLRPEAICCCCGDCCVLLKLLTRYPRPAELYASNYYVEFEPELCSGCEECVDRCQLEARVMMDGIATVNHDRCIGCGNCVVLCPSNANQLKKKEEEFLPLKDKEAFNMEQLSRRVGKLNVLKIRMKMFLGLRV